MELALYLQRSGPMNMPAIFDAFPLLESGDLNAQRIIQEGAAQKWL